MFTFFIRVPGPFISRLHTYHFWATVTHSSSYVLHLFIQLLPITEHPHPAWTLGLCVNRSLSKALLSFSSSIAWVNRCIFDISACMHHLPQLNPNTQVHTTNTEWCFSLTRKPSHYQPGVLLALCCYYFLLTQQGSSLGIERTDIVLTVFILTHKVFSTVCSM